MEDKIKSGYLYDFYGELLTEHQRSVYGMSINDDLSLSEIAQNENITRQAVRDIIKKGENKLFEFEEKLKVMERMFKQDDKIANILAEITKIENKTSDKQVAKILTHVKKELNGLV